MLNQQRLVPLIVAALGYVVKYIAYNFLTPVVLITFAALMFIYITLIGPEIPFYQQASFLFPIDIRNVTMDEEDIMRVYGVLTMVLFVLSVAGGWLIRVLKRMINPVYERDIEAEAAQANIPSTRSPLTSAKRRLIVGGIVITIIYVVLFIVIPFAHMSEGTSFLSMYAVFVVFYVLAMISNVVYIGIDILSDMVLGWAWSKVLAG